MTGVIWSIFTFGNINPGPCFLITTIQCGTIISVNTGFNTPDPDYPNGMNGQGCSLDTLQGGPAKIYRFMVSATGTYQFNITQVSGSVQFYEYYYKSSTVCDNTGWNCLGRTDSAVSLSAINWNAGDTILILVKAEANTSSVQKFTILCETEVCNSMQNIICGDTVAINVFGMGDPDYPNGMNGAGCDSAIFQGGREVAYSFVVPNNGSYKVTVISGQGGNQRVAYYYKDSSMVCNNTGWHCLGEASMPGVVLPVPFNLLAGDTILFLINAQQRNGTIQSFVVDSVSLTGIDQSANNLPDLLIIPNPTSALCIITYPAFNNSVLTLYDLTGRALVQQPFNTQAQLNLSGFSAGMYVIELRDKEGRGVKGKVVKE